jgi:ABC-type branched-subunit amino acid transport system substrate-binding protein
MFGNWKRLMTLGVLALGIAGCKVIPDDGRPPVVTPTPEPTETPDDVLPTDDGRHRIALLVPLSGANGAVGQAIANATTMALLDTNAANLRITTYDTATGAGSAAARAVRDGN